MASVLIAGFLLAGCAAPRVAAPAAPAVVSAPPPPAEAAPTPAPIAPAAPPAPIAQSPAAVLDEAAVRAQYGPPDFVRKESDSELWRYDAADCALFLFLYRENDTYRLRYMESLPRGTDGGPDAACMASIKARGAPPS
jgi:hypothetical protein